LTITNIQRQIIKKQKLNNNPDLQLEKLKNKLLDDNNSANTRKFKILNHLDDLDDY
jgi:hypothetical protein